MDETAETRLRTLAGIVTAAEARLAEARKNRDDAIRQYVAARQPVTAIARAANVSRQAIYDIAGPPPPTTAQQAMAELPEATP